MRKLLVLAVVFSAVWPTIAFAQAGRTVTVLLPEQFQVDESVALDLFEALGEAVSQHPDYALADLPPQTLPDLREAIGCVDDGPECLELLGEILETNLILWGEVGAAGNAHLVELTLWDVDRGAAHYQYSKAVDGDADALSAVMPILARGVVFGPVGEIEIRVDPADARIEFDSQAVPSESPLLLTGLELGPHVIRVSRDGYFEARETVFVDVDLTEVSFELVPTTVEVVEEGGRLWTWVALGTGVALAGAGVAFALASQDSQDAYDAAASQIQVDLDELQSLQDDGESSALLANVFFGAGGAALVAAVVLFFVEGDTETVTRPAGSDAAGARFGLTGQGFTVEF